MHELMRLALRVSVVILAIAAGDMSAAERMAVEPAEEGYWLLDGGRRVLFYQSRPRAMEDGTYERANYVHPLYGLDGQTLTEDFPRDHRHHRGVFWAWHEIRVGGEKPGDSWTTEDFACVVGEVVPEHLSDERATLRARVDWTSPHITDGSGQPVPFVEEVTRITLHRAGADRQLLDFDIRLRATRPDVQIGGADNVKGYSGFSVRLKAPEDITIVDAAGPLSEDGILREGLPWLDVSGQFDGGKTASGVAILSHPDFPPGTQWHHIRHQGLQNIVFPGRELVDVPTEEPLRLRYRLMIHRGPVEPAELQAAQEAFAREGDSTARAE